MRVVGLEIKNTLRLKAFEVRPGDDPVVTISGKNGQGKTSAVRAMLMALRGTRAHPKEALRRGTTKGSTELDLGDLKIKLDLRKGKAPKLAVFGADGEKLKKPQKILDNLCGEQTLDARRFSDLDGAGRIAVVRGLTGLDFTKHDAERAGVYEKRKGANGEVKRITGALDSTVHHADAPDAVVTVAQLSSELQLGMEKNAANDKAREALAEFRKRGHEQVDRVADSQERLVLAKEMVKEVEGELAEAEKLLDSMRGDGATRSSEVEKLRDVALDEIRTQIATAEETNEKVRANTEYDKLGAELNVAQAEAEKLTDHIAAMDGVKADAIAKADYPVDGLTVGDDDVMLNGFDFGQAGGAEKLVAGAAIDLALHPDFEVVVIDEGGNLDAESRAALEAWAETSKVQIWYIVAGEEPGSVIIEDGMVKEAAGDAT